MVEIYAAVYPGEHYLHGIALSNLASVWMNRGACAEAADLYREAIGMWERTLSPAHLNTGIGRIQLGRGLLRQGLYAEAQRESLAGYEVVRGQASPSVSWLVSARQDLVAAYEALGEPELADAYR